MVVLALGLCRLSGELGILWTDSGVSEALSGLDLGGFRILSGISGWLGLSGLG